jgi:hypothetical protein
MKAKANCANKVHSDQMVLGTFRLDLMISGPRHSKTKISSRGAIRLKSIQIGWFPRWPGGWLDCVNGGQRRSKRDLETTLGIQGN